MEKENDFYEVYGQPMTSRQFIKLYDFNNPRISEYWDSILQDELYKDEPIKVIKEEETFGDYKIKICYL